MGWRDDSRNRHATRHFRATVRPIVQSLEPGEGCRRRDAYAQMETLYDTVTGSFRFLG